MNIVSAKLRKVEWKTKRIHSFLFPRRSNLSKVTEKYEQDKKQLFFKPRNSLRSHDIGKKRCGAVKTKKPGPLGGNPVSCFIKRQ